MSKLVFNYHALFEHVKEPKEKIKELAEGIQKKIGGDVKISDNDLNAVITSEESIISLRYEQENKFLFLEMLNIKKNIADEIIKNISNSVNGELARVFNIPKTKEEFIALDPNSWFFEAYEMETRGVTLAIKGKKLFSQRSPFQLVDVYQTVGFGKMLALDKMVMLTDADEFSYHEMITHPALHVHQKPENVLVIGGGDGGSVREILKHEDVKEVHLCEIDKMVIDVSLKYFPNISSKLKDPKLKIFYEDGFSFLENKKAKYDIIIVDSTDPVGPGVTLFTEEFYKRCFDALKEDGILITQCESFFFHTKFIAETLEKLRKFFPKVWYYYTQTPTYPSGCYGFSFCSKKYHPIKDVKEKKLLEPVKYYNKNHHKAAFMLPTFALDAFYAGCEDQKKELEL